MPKRIPKRDPGAEYVRKAKAARRVGENTHCAFCDESRPEALIAGSTPMICFACDRAKNGRTTMDNHHVAGEANGPITVPVPVNEHRGELSPAQYDWPRETLENPDGSPLLKAAAHIRGITDTVLHLIEQGLLWVAEALEWLHTYLIKELGPKWWVGTPLEKLAPRS